MSNRWADELKDTVDSVKTLRDELKVQMHLGSMAAKSRFAELERRLDNEQLLAQKNFKELVGGFRAVKAEFDQRVIDATEAARA